MNVLKMECLRSLVGVSLMDRVRNEVVHRRVGIEKGVGIEMVWARGENG